MMTQIFDRYGRVLYSSSGSDHSGTSVRWAPNGQLFSVGSFNTIRVCDVSGWTLTTCKTADTGSVIYVHVQLFISFSFVYQ